VKNPYKYPSKYCGNFCFAINNFFQVCKLFTGRGFSGYEKLYQGFLNGKTSVEPWCALPVGHPLTLYSLS